NAKIAHQFQHVACAADVDTLAIALVLHAELVPPSDVEDAIHAGHRRAHALLLGHVALRHRDAERGQILRLRGAAHEGDNLVATFDQLPCHTPADESGRAGHEVLHIRSLSAKCLAHTSWPDDSLAGMFIGGNVRTYYHGATARRDYP